MKLRIKWVEEVSFLAQTETNHAILMDGAPEGGGRNLGPRPMETMLAGTGGCTAYDVVTILPRRARTFRTAWSRSMRSGPRRTPRCSPRSTSTSS